MVPYFVLVLDANKSLSIGSAKARIVSLTIK